MGLFNYDLEPRRDIIFMDVKSNYASIECVLRGLDPLKASLCVMSHAANSSGLILAASPTFKKVFGKSNISRSGDLPFFRTTRKFNYKQWYDSNSPDRNGVVCPPSRDYVAQIEYWARHTYIVPPQMSLYIEKNFEINQILTEFTSPEEIHTYSVDESFLDVTESLNYFYPEIEDRGVALDLLTKKIQLKIFRETGLYASMGMSNCNPLLAKIALDNYAKKCENMRSLINYEQVEEMVWGIPELTDFWGIGARTKKRLNSLGIFTIKDLANYNPDVLKQHLGVIGVQLLAHANGIDETTVYDVYERKSESYGNNQTLPRDYILQSEIEVVLLEMCEQIAVRLRQNNKYATCISFYIGFSIKENRKSLKATKKTNPTYHTKEIQEFVLRLFKERYTGGAVRRIGVSGDGLVTSMSKQLSLFETADSEENELLAKEEKIQAAVDKIRGAYNFSAVQNATSLTTGSRVIERTKMIGGHSAGGYEGLS